MRRHVALTGIVMCMFAFVPIETTRADDLPDLNESELFRQLATHVYLTRSSESLPSGVNQRAEYWSRDDSTGLDVQVCEVKRRSGSKMLVVSFGGTDLLRGMQDGMKDVWTDIRQGTPDLLPQSGIDRQYAAALDTARLMQAIARKEKAELVFVGHSLGGGLAQYAAISLGERAECFSAAPLGEKIVKTLSPHQIAANEARVRHYVTPGDPVWFLPNTIHGSRHYGRVFITPPPRNLDGVVPRDQHLIRAVGVAERTGDLMARHMAHTDVPLSIPDSFRQGMSVADALQDRPPIWRAMRIAPKTKALESQVEALDRMTTNATRIAVFGEGADAAELQRRLGARLGPANVLRVAKELPTRELYRSVADFHPDVIVGFQDHVPRTHEEYGEVDRLLLRADTLNKVSDAARSLTWFSRMCQGLAKDPKQISDPIMRAHAARFNGLFGDSLTHPTVKATLGRWDDLSKRFTFGLVAANDLVALSQGEWKLQDSQVVGYLVDEKVQKGIDRLSQTFLKRGATIPALATSGVIPIAKGAWEQSRTGGTLTADALDHYLEGVVAVSWGGLGYALTGNPAVANRFSDAGVTLGQIGRSIAAEPMNRRAHAQNIGAYYEQWATEQISLACRTSARLPTFQEFLSEKGVPTGLVSRDVVLAGNDLHRAAQRDQQAHFPGSLQTLIIKPGDTHTTRVLNDLETAGRLASHGETRVVISDQYRQGEAVYRWATERYGKDNVRIISECHSRYTERRIADEFGAAVVIHVGDARVASQPNLRAPDWDRDRKIVPPRQNSLLHPGGGATATAGWSADDS